MTPHQQRLTAARDAVVEAAKEFINVDRPSRHNLYQAVRALEAIEQETSNG